MQMTTVKRKKHGSYDGIVRFINRKYEINRKIHFARINDFNLSSTCNDFLSQRTIRRNEDNGGGELSTLFEEMNFTTLSLFNY